MWTKNPIIEVNKISDQRVNLNMIPNQNANWDSANQTNFQGESQMEDLSETTKHQFANTQKSVHV